MESGDWDRPFSDEELQAIDAVFLNATSTALPCSSSTELSKRHLSTFAPPNDDADSTSSSEYSKNAHRRRLPESLFVFQRRNSTNSFSPSPCRLNSISFRSPYQGNIRTRYQAIEFKGRIVYSKTLGEVEASAKELLNFIEDKKMEEGQAMLGFDTEWRPTLRRGASPGKAAVLQICSDINICYVMHIFHSGITPSLQYLLENSTSLKVGVNISYDSQKIFKDHNVSMQSLQDLSNLANKKFGGRKKWSLSALTEELLAKQLPKPNMIRLGNWEANILSKEQLRYAATDAFVSWRLFQVLNSLPDACTVSIHEEPAQPALATDISIHQ